MACLRASRRCSPTCVAPKTCRRGLARRVQLLLPGIELGGALGLAERVLGAVRSCEELAKRGVTVSVGIAAWEPDDLPNDLLRRADERLYAAKHNGGDSVAAGTDATGVQPPRPRPLAGESSRATCLVSSTTTHLDCRMVADNGSRGGQQGRFPCK